MGGGSGRRLGGLGEGKVGWRVGEVVEGRGKGLGGKKYMSVHKRASPSTPARISKQKWKYDATVSGNHTENAERNHSQQGS